MHGEKMKFTCVDINVIQLRRIELRNDQHTQRRVGQLMQSQ